MSTIVKNRLTFSGKPDELAEISKALLHTKQDFGGLVRTPAELDFSTIIPMPAFISKENKHGVRSFSRFSRLYWGTSGVCSAVYVEPKDVNMQPLTDKLVVAFNTKDTEPEPIAATLGIWFPDVLITHDFIYNNWTVCGVATYHHEESEHERYTDCKKARDVFSRVMQSFDAYR